MHSIFIIASGLVASALAYTPPTEPTWGPLLTPDLTTPVTQGETSEITWDPEDHETEGVTVSLVLCHGPSSNCVPEDSAIVEGVPADAKSYSWDVPSDLPVGTASTETGYGILIIVDGTGEFQYSTQFSVLEGDSKPADTTSSASSSSKQGLGSGSWTTKDWESSFPPNATATSYSYTHSGYDSYLSSGVYATTTASDSLTTVAPTTTGSEVFSFGLDDASSTATSFTGAAAMPTGNAGNVLGLVAGGALAILAL